jgi:hypothetical protein
MNTNTRDYNFNNNKLLSTIYANIKHYNLTAGSSGSVVWGVGFDLLNAEIVGSIPV